METKVAPARKHPPKRFYVPPDINALGGYAVSIRAAMHSEYRRRMSGSKG